MSDWTIYLREGLPVRPIEETVGWLWRVPLSPERFTTAVGLGTIDQGAALDGMLRSGGLAGVAVFGAQPGPDQGRVPGRQRCPDVARSDMGLACCR